MDTQRVFSNRISSGEYLSFSAIEITSIPDISITHYLEEQEALANNAAMLSQTFSSVFDIYKTQLSSTNCDVAIELVWISTPTSNQTHAASIRLIVIFRSIAQPKEISESIVSRISNILMNTLEVESYSIKGLTDDELKTLIATVGMESRQAIAKDTHSESLPLPAMPKCVYYDCFDSDPPALELLVNTLIKSPNSMVAFHLLPVRLEHDEKEYISGTCQALNVLGSGLHDPAFGVIPVVAAQKCLDTYNYYHSNDDHPMFVFSAYVMSDLKYSHAIVSSVRALLSGKKQVSTRIIPLDSFSPQNIRNNYIAIPWHIEELIFGSSQSYGRAFKRLPHIITADEAVSLFSLPIGGSKVSAGFTIDYSSKQGKEYRSSLIDSDNISVGKLKSSNGEHIIGFSRDDLAKHMLIVGTPGSGKTTFSVGLLDRLWKQGIPFLVIEPAKNEYRALVQSIPDLQVFTPGKNLISPFVFNPFLPPENVRLESYKSVLKTAFEAGVTMTSPLDKIFEETVNNCYSDFGWLDSYTSRDKGRVFNIADFIRCFQHTVDDIGYTGEASNIAKAGVVRLKGLTTLFDTYHSIPISDLLSKPTVIELAAIENQDEKALIIALLLLSIMSYINANYSGDSHLRNVILIEEAHVLLDSQSHGGEGAANPSAVAQGLVKRMLAEIRSYGVGLIIADQSPRKVTTDVVALTDIKLAFRLVESEDKRILADSVNMTDEQVGRLARLRPGEAFFFFNKLDEPEEVVTENYRLEHKIDITLSDMEIARLSTYWVNNPLLLKPYPECSYCRHCSKSCDYQRRVLAREIARRVFVRHLKATSDGKVPKQAAPRLARILNTIAQETEISKDDRAFANDLFIRHFMTAGGNQILKEVFSHVNEYSKQEANGERITPELSICIKVHLFRRIMYETQLQVSQTQIAKSLSM